MLALLALAALLGGAAAANVTAPASVAKHSGWRRCRSGWGYCGGRCCDHQNDAGHCGWVSASGRNWQRAFAATSTTALGRQVPPPKRKR